MPDISDIFQSIRDEDADKNRRSLARTYIMLDRTNEELRGTIRAIDSYKDEIKKLIEAESTPCDGAVDRFRKLCNRFNLFRKLKVKDVIDDNVDEVIVRLKSDKISTRNNPSLDDYFWDDKFPRTHRGPRFSLETLD